MTKGILFDLDGILTYSEVFFCKAALMMFSDREVKVLLPGTYEIYSVIVSKKLSQVPVELLN